MWWDDYWQSTNLLSLTKEILEENEAEKVYPNTGQLCHQHDGVPGPDGEGHHGQLREDERSEADGDDVQEVLLKQKQGSEHDDTSLIERDENPDEERLVAETPTLGQLLVQLGVGHGHLPRHVPVEYQGEDRELGVDGGVSHHQQSWVQTDRAEVEDCGEHGLHGGDDQTWEERIIITEQSSMNSVLLTP